MAQPQIQQYSKADFNGVRHHHGHTSRNERSETIKRLEAAGASAETIDALKALDDTLRKIEAYRRSQ